MHYRNGRPAKAGDRVLANNSGHPIVGIVYNPMTGALTCNARLAPVTTSDPYVTLSDCLLLEDVSAVPYVAPAPTVVEFAPRAEEPKV